MRTAIIAAIGASLLLGGCGIHFPAAIPKLSFTRVPTPVPIACKPSVAQPQLVDTDAALKAAPSTADWVRLLAAGRLQRIGYIADLEAGLAACGATPSPPATALNTPTGPP